MKRPYLIKNPEKRKRIVHLLSAVTILIHAFENYETGHHSWQLFAVAGVTVLILVLFHAKIEKKFPWIDGAFFAIEAVLSFVICYDLFHHGKKALPFTYLALGLFQLFMAFKKGRKGIREHAQHAPPKKEK